MGTIRRIGGKVEVPAEEAAPEVVAAEAAVVVTEVEAQEEADSE